MLFAFLIVVPLWLEGDNLFVLLTVSSAVLNMIMVSSISNFLRDRERSIFTELEKYPQTKSEEMRTLGFTALPPSRPSSEDII